MPTVAIDTLGCKVNQYETEVIRACFERAGYRSVPFSGVADLYIVNTCSVTATSDAKSRQALRAARRRNPAAIVVAVGCYAQVARDTLAAMPEVDLVLGSVGKTGLPDVIEAYRRTGAQPAVTPLTSGLAFEPMEAAGFERTRAVMKIQDGCNNFCSYCIIPYARGRIRSKPPSDALREFERLVEEGYREIVLTGIEIASYGGGAGEDFSLTGLLRDMAGSAGEVRVRLGSLEPRIVTQDFARALSDMPFVCPQFHLSLQSGCDATLRRMNRKYDKQRYRQSAALLREALPDAELTTDIIVGFPGESQADFEESRLFVTESEFLKVHVFPYSRRPGTPAADMPNQIERAEKERRVLLMSETAQAARTRRLAAQVGRRLPTLIERERDGLWHGFTPAYMPVAARGQARRGEVASVLIESADDDGLIGAVVGD